MNPGSTICSRLYMLARSRSLGCPPPLAHTRTRTPHTQVITQRMYRDLVTGVAKAHLPEAAPLRFPEGYFVRLQRFQTSFGLAFAHNEVRRRPRCPGSE